ncbi:ATP-binding protein [Streptomyces sp. YIM 98790]|uniref:ATP-binding protein n=1 Tax=Streptomyces sp. YIM 98790 TaxID=2689077 RepID=UPI00140C5CEC|nr:ATP-binding protein [Streptomyces sp. YIM 98790]
MDANHSSPPSRGRSGAQDAAGGTEGAAERVVELVAGDFLLTLNPVDGSQIEPCPPSRRPISPRRFPEMADVFSGPTHPPLLEREEERERLTRLIGRGRSVRLTGPSGTGRTALLAAVARECTDLAPDGVIRLSGHRRTATDLKHELYAAIHLAGGYRPGPVELHTALREIGAVVIIDDIEFGGTALDELLDSTPECAYLISATPQTPAPTGESRMEEVFLAGISRTGCLELLEQLVERPLTDAETDWAADLWFGCEGLPLRFVQAGTLLRQRDHQIGGLDAPSLSAIHSPALALVTDGGLTGGAREILRVAFALGGELPGLGQLPALTADNDAATAHALLVDSGLITRTGDNYRLAAGVAEDLAGAGFAEGAAGRTLTAAQHYSWWLGQHSPATVAARDGGGEDGGTAAEIAAETGVLLAVVQEAQRAGHGAAVSALARTAAPLLAATLRWSAWERVLRTGQEAARAEGLVADQAFFHHELGVLAICQGQADRARSELEASIALRSVLADSGGAHAGRRALALAEDLSRPVLPPGAAGAPALPAGAAGTGTTASAAVPDDHAMAEEQAQMPGPEDVTELLEPVSGPFPDPGAAYEGRRAGLKGLAVAGTRRNAVAAGAGALLIAVLGAVVTLGLTSQDAEAPTDDTLPGPTLSETDGEGLDGATGETSDSSTSRPPSDSADPTESEDTEGETESPDTGTDTSGTTGTAGAPGGTSGSGGSSSSSSSSGGGSTGDTTATPSPSGSPTSSSGSSSTGGSSSTTTGGSGDSGGTSTGSTGPTQGTTTGTDQGTTTGADQGTTTGTDEGTTTGTDAGADGGADAGADGGADGGADAGADGGTDEGTDGGPTATASPSPDPTESVGSPLTLA